MRLSLAPLALACLLTSAPAAAQSLGGPTGGLWGDVAAGLGAAGRPFSAGVGWTAALGGFVGRHDDAFAVGRRWGVGLRARQDIDPRPASSSLRTGVAIDVHRALDLLVANVQIGGSIGPWIQTSLPSGPPLPAGIAARLSAGATWRVHRFVGVHARIEAGIDTDHRGPFTVSPALGVSVGAAWARPTRGR